MCPYTEVMTSPIDAVIFDIDNVLINTRHSYLEAIRWTVEIYLTHGDVPLFTKTAKHDPLLLTHFDVDRFKLLGGFNDDWDCCYGILVYLLGIPIEKRTLTELRKKANFEKLLKEFPNRPVGVNGMVKRFGRPPFVTIEKISRIFQEIYLGGHLFEVTERRKPIYWKKRGLIYKEKLIFKKALLEKLKAHGLKLGIATGRSRFEAVFSLKGFGVLDYFDHITTADEVKKAEQEQKCSLRKPHPFSLIETAKKIGLKKNFVYVGDLPDDVMAANHAKAHCHMHSVAFSTISDSVPAAAEMKKAKPDYFIRKPSELFKLLTRKRKA